jgi:hypothetical protein
VELESSAVPDFNSSVAGSWGGRPLRPGAGMGYVRNIAIYQLTLRISKF